MQDVLPDSRSIASICDGGVSHVFIRRKNYADTPSKRYREKLNDSAVGNYRPSHFARRRTRSKGHKGIAMHRAAKDGIRVNANRKPMDETRNNGRDAMLLTGEEIDAADDGLVLESQHQGLDTKDELIRPAEDTFLHNDITAALYKGVTDTVVAMVMCNFARIHLTYSQLTARSAGIWLPLTLVWMGLVGQDAFSRIMFLENCYFVILCLI